MGSTWVLNWKSQLSGKFGFVNEEKVLRLMLFYIKASLKCLEGFFN